MVLADCQLPAALQYQLYIGRLLLSLHPTSFPDPDHKWQLRLYHAMENRTSIWENQFSEESFLTFEIPLTLQYCINCGFTFSLGHRGHWPCKSFQFSHQKHHGSFGLGRLSKPAIRWCKSVSKLTFMPSWKPRYCLVLSWFLTFIFAQRPGRYLFTIVG